MSGTQLYRGGRVRPMDGARSSDASAPGAGDTTALVIKDGRIIATGSDADMRALAGSGATTIDLDGATVLPGFVDTHPHLFHFSLLEYPLVRLWDATSHDDIVQRISARAATTPAGEWIMATPVGEPHYFIRRSWRDLAEHVLPDRHVLDRAAPDHPVWLQAWGPTTPNICVFNSAALRALGIDRATDSRQSNVWIEKDRNGDPTGRLSGPVNIYYTGDAYMDELLMRVPPLDPSIAIPATLDGVASYHRLGVTTIYEGHVMGPAEIGLFQALRQMNQLRMRVLTSLEAEQYSMPWQKPISDEEFVDNLTLSRDMTSTSDDLLRHNGVTLSRGGPLNPGFLRMREPYIGPYGELTRGREFVAPARERVALEFCAAHDVRLNFIGAGYADHDDFLANAEELAARVPIRHRRWILQHNYLCTEDHARRYAGLGFVVTTSMSFSCAKGDLFEKRIGSHVWKDLIPLRRLLDAGLTVAGGSDWGPKNIFEHIALAETHEFWGSGRRNDGPAQKIGREDALRMWTCDAASALGWEGVGSLAPGNHADLIVVDRDTLTCPTEDLAATKVLRTVLGGEVVHDTMT
ncbi:MAG TPA: amidohydrolase family protein [Candidatus Limnocylindrales bacterium]|nr:amidohydrolase family protein [Candidatus Limnocylindrales bacterium]